MAVALDLATKIVSPEQNIWSVFPGRDKRFFELFLSERIVFLDTPGLKLTSTILESDDLLRQNVAMSRAIRQWHRSRDPGNPPSRRAASYPIQRTRSDSAAFGNVRRLFIQAKVGDLELISGSFRCCPVELPRAVFDDLLQAGLIRQDGPEDQQHRMVFRLTEDGHERANQRR